MSFRNSLSATSEPRLAPYIQTRFAQASNEVSSVRPRSSVMGSNCVSPGDLRLVEGSPPSRFSITPVTRVRPETRVTAGMYFPSHFTRNLKFLYGSRRVGLTVNSAMRGRIHEPKGELYYLAPIKDARAAAPSKS